MQTISIDVKVIENIILLLNQVENIDDDLQKEINDIRGKVALYKALFEWDE